MDSDEPQQPAVGESAGQQLKRAREQHGLSQKDIADAQHLRVSVIQAIEEGSYNQIDSELFLKGYVRAYARQVGADADALVELLDVELEPLRLERAKQEQENPLADIERRRLKKRRIAKTLGILILLGAFAFLAWKYVIEPRITVDEPTGQQQSQSETAIDNLATAAEVGTDGAEAGTTEGAPFEQDGAEIEAPATVEESETPVDANAATASGDSVIAGDGLSGTSGGSVDDDASADVMIGEDNSNSAPERPETGETDTVPDNPQPVEQTASVEPVLLPDPVFQESAQPESVAAPTELEMSFVSDCWVQVTDSSGARLVASLQREGDQISVAGRAPFNVVFGAVDAVDTVRFDGEPVDLSGFRVVNNRTEFTLTL